MKFSPIKISVVLAALLQTSVFALTLEEASKDVLNTNPEIKERLEHYRDTKYDYEIAKSGFMPKVDISATAGREKYRNKAEPDTVAGGAKYNTNNTRTYGATLNQNIFNGFSSYYDLQAQKSRVLSSEYFLKEKSDEILLTIVQYYINSLRKYQQLQIEKENVEAHKKTYEKVKERKEVGYSTVSELWQAESRYVLAQSNLVSSELAYEDSLANFAKVYGKDVMAQKLVKPEFELQLPNSLEDAVSIALANNPTIKTEEYNANVVKSQYRGSYSSFYPKVDFDLSASRSMNGSGTPGTIDSMSGAFKLYYNLFNGFSDFDRTRKYLVGINSQAATLDNAKLKLTEKLRLSWDSYILLTRQLEFLKQHTDLSRKTVDAYNEEFLLGRRTIIDLLGAESEYNSAKRELVGTEYDLLHAKFRVYDAMYGLTDALVKKEATLDGDAKSVLFKNYSPDAMDSEKRIQKALEKNKKPEEPAVAPVAAPEQPTSSSVPVSAPQVAEQPKEVSVSVPLAQPAQTTPTEAMPEKVATESQQQAKIIEETQKAPVAQSIENPDKIVENTPATPSATAQVPAEPVKETAVKDVPAQQQVVSQEDKIIETPAPQVAKEAQIPAAPEVAPIVQKSVEKTQAKTAKTVTLSPNTGCYKVTTDKLLTRQSPSEASKKVGYLLKNWKACSELNKDGWIKLPNGWANTGYMSAIKEF